MQLKKNLLVSFVFSVAFFIIGWLLSPWLLDYIGRHLVSLAKDVTIIESTTQAQLNIRLKTSLSFAFVPLLGMGICLAIQQLKKKTLTTWDCFFYFLIVLTAYLLGSVFKFYALEATVVNVLNHPRGTQVQSTLPLGQAQLYDWAFYASIIAAIAVGLLAKNKKIR
jgi:hypothetical protein